MTQKFLSLSSLKCVHSRKTSIYLMVFLEPLPHEIVYDDTLTEFWSNEVSDNIWLLPICYGISVMTLLLSTSCPEDFCQLIKKVNRNSQDEILSIILLFIVPSTASDSDTCTAIEITCLFSGRWRAEGYSHITWTPSFVLSLNHGTGLQLDIIITFPASTCRSQRLTE